MFVFTVVVGLDMQKSPYEGPNFIFSEYFLAFLQDLIIAVILLETRMLI